MLGGAMVWTEASGAPFWHDPRPHRLVDGILAPLVAIALYRLVTRWVDARAARVAVMLYAIGLLGSLTVFAAGGLAARNLACGGSAQLLVGLCALLLLLGRALSPWPWSMLLLVASAFHPQIAFVPLLMMTLLEPRSLLVAGLVGEARGAAIRCAGLSMLAIGVSRAASLGVVRVDAANLPMAWWIASWLMAGEVLMPPVGRGLVAVILCAVSVQDFHAWPAMALVFLAAFAAARLGATRPAVRGELCKENS